MKTSLIVRQLVDYPRCRIYRGFLRGLEQDATIKVLKTSYLYYYILLCSYANYRTSYRRIGKTSHVIGPGEWIFQQKELMRCFRVNRPGLLYPILGVLEQNHYISLVRLNEGKLIKVRIREWKKFNTALEYNAPCENVRGS